MTLLQFKEFSRSLILNSAEVNEIYLHPDNFGREKCGIAWQRNKSIIAIGEEGYEGIPGNFFVNVCGWTILMFLFSLLSQSAWKHKKSYSTRSYDQSWVELFYGDAIGPKLIYSNRNAGDKVVLFTSEGEGWCFWFRVLCKIGPDHVRIRSGQDAIEYLSFQRHIIIYTLIICILTCIFILPLNWMGDLEDERKTFARSTMSNLSSDSPLMWIHASFSLLFVFLGIFFMRHFSLLLRVQEKTCWVKRTILVQGIGNEYRSVTRLKEFIKETFSNYNIEDIQFVFDVRKLTKLNYKRETAQEAKMWCEAELELKNKSLQMKPKLCGIPCSLCIFCGKVDALDHYSHEEENLNLKINKEKEFILNNPLEFAFVTFESEAKAKDVIKQAPEKMKEPCCEPNMANVHPILLCRNSHWKFSPAPTQKNVIWENIGITGKCAFFSMFINVVLFLVLFFFTTPAIVITTSHLLPSVRNLKKMNPVVSEFLPMLALWLLSLCLPAVVSFSNQFIYFKTSAYGFVQWAITKSNETYRWECIFLPDNGAFFVNYVITSGFVGTAVQFIRIPEMLCYIIFICMSYSAAEKPSVRKAVLWEFNFGVQYAWYLLIFALVIIYSIPCPVITLFGWSTITIGNFVFFTVTIVTCCIQFKLPFFRFASSLALPHLLEVKEEKLSEDEEQYVPEAYIPEVLR